MRYRALLSDEGAIVVRSWTETWVDRAAELRAEYPVLRLPDELQLATALQSRCRSFMDRREARSAADRNRARRAGTLT